MMLDRLLDHDEQSGFCQVPVVIKAFINTTAWRAFQPQGIELIHGITYRLSRGIVLGVQQGTRPSFLLTGSPVDVEFCGPMVVFGSHQYLFGVPRGIADHMTLYDWEFSESLRSNYDHRKNTTSGSASGPDSSPKPASTKKAERSSTDRD